MLLNNDGSFTRDIDIEKLSVSFGGHCGRAITLYKNKITYRNTVTSTIAGMDFPKGYFDSKTVPLSREDFVKISKDIHNAGLLSILVPNENTEVLDGAVYETMHCVFDDGSHYHYCDFSSRTANEFQAICDILLACCKVDNTSREPITVALSPKKIVPTVDDVESDKNQYEEMLKIVDELRCRINGHISFLKIYGERSADTVAVIEDILSKIIEIENQLSDNRQIYDKLKNDYINYGSGKELEL